MLEVRPCNLAEGISPSISCMRELFLSGCDERGVAEDRPPASREGGSCKEEIRGTVPTQAIHVKRDKSQSRCEIYEFIFPFSFFSFLPNEEFH